MSIEKIIDKVRKLLALSTSPNESEAKRAFAKAQELSAKHGVDIDAVNEKSREIKPAHKPIRRFWKGASLPKDAFAFMRLSRQYRCLASYGKNDIYLTGLPEDIEIAESMLHYGFNAYLACFEVAWAVEVDRLIQVYVDETPLEEAVDHKALNRMLAYDKGDKRISYALGFVDGIIRHLAEQATSMALVIVTPQTVMQYHREITKPGKSLANPHAGGFYEKGQSDGKTAFAPNRLT